MIIGLCGKAGSGKDTVADILVRDHGFVKVAFADPLKRICRDVFDFTDQQLWGPSESRNEPDFRYCRTPHQKGYDPVDGRPTSINAEYLTARYALQKLGTEWGRDCYADIWIEYAMRIAKRLESGGHIYDAIRGLSSVSFVGNDAHGAHDRLKRNVVISDVRFLNEVEGLKKRGARVVKIVRPSQGLKGQAGAHVSETEMDSIPQELFDFTIDNQGSLEDLVVMAEGLLSKFSIETRDNEFAQMLAGIDMSTEPDRTALVTMRKTEDKPVIEDVVEFKLTTKTVTPEGIEVLDPETPAQAGLRGMLEDRQRDVEAGKIRPYDPAQRDVPPFKRK